MSNPNLPDGLQRAAEELLKVVRRPHTDGELKEAQRILEEERKKALEHPPYAEALERIKREYVTRGETDRMEHEVLRSSYMEKASETRAKYGAKLRKVRCRPRSFEEANNALSDGLGCPNPACRERGENRGNIVNGVPICMACWHRLVPKSKFGDFNRAYWRKWNKKTS